jgi:O-antigen/teichoic acid export membrane protein
MNQTKRIAINTTSNWAAIFVNMAVMIFLTKFLLQRLGAEKFGMFRYVITIQSSLLFLDMGLATTLNRFTSQLLAIKDYARLNSVASFSFFVFFGLGLLAGVVMVGLGYALPGLVVGGSANLYSNSFLLMSCIGVVQALKFWGYSARGLLQGVERYDLVSGVQAGEALLRAVLITFMFIMVPSSGFVTIGLCFISSALFEILLLWVCAKRQIPALRLRISSVSTNIAKETMSFSVFVFIMAVTTMLIWNAPMLLAGRFYGPETVAFISLPLLLLEQVQRIAGGFGFVLVPVAGKYSAAGKPEMLQKLTITGTKYCVLLCFPIGILCVIFGHSVFEWFKEGFGWTWALLGILMVPYLIRMTQRPAVCVLFGAKSIRQLAIGQIGLVVIIGILSWFLGKYLSMGVYGIVLGAAIPILFFNSIFQTMYMCHQIGLGWLSYMRRSYIDVFWGIIPSAVIAIILVKYAYPKSLIMILVEGLLCMFVFVMFAWLFILNGEERKQFLSIFRHSLSAEVANVGNDNETESDISKSENVCL